MPTTRFVSEPRLKLLKVFVPPNYLQTRVGADYKMRSSEKNELLQIKFTRVLGTDGPPGFAQKMARANLMGLADEILTLPKINL